MKRAVAALLLLLAPGAAGAWTFSPQPVCTLSHVTEAATAVVVTYDPATALYAIEITLPSGWPQAASFSIRFDGPRGLTISTTRHQLSDGGRRLTVTDTGFGNVLYGIEFNDTATAIAGGTAVPIPLHGAAEPLGAFRACPAPLAS